MASWVWHKLPFFLHLWVMWLGDWVFGHLWVIWLDCCLFWSSLGTVVGWMGANSEYRVAATCPWIFLSHLFPDYFCLNILFSSSPRLFSPEYFVVSYSQIILNLNISVQSRTAFLILLMFFKYWGKKLFCPWIFLTQV